MTTNKKTDMNFFDTTAFLIIGLLIAIGGRGLDLYSSKDFEYYGGKESNWFNQDEYGFFSIPKHLAMTVVFAAIGIVIGIFNSFGASMFLICVGIASGIMGVLNIGKNRKARKRQIETLRDLRILAQNASQERIDQFFTTLQFRKAKERIFYWRFGWIYSTSPYEAVALAECRRTIVKLVMEKQESEWFPR